LCDDEVCCFHAGIYGVLWALQLPDPQFLGACNFWKCNCLLCAICEIYCAAAEILINLLRLTFDRHSNHGKIKKCPSGEGPTFWAQHPRHLATRVRASFNAALIVSTQYTSVTDGQTPHTMHTRRVVKIVYKSKSATC